GGVPAGTFGAYAAGSEGAGHARVGLDVGQVHVPGAGQVGVEGGVAGVVDGRAGADVEAPARRQERHLHVQRDDVGAGPLGVGDQVGGADPDARLLVEGLAGGPGAFLRVVGGDDGVLVGGFARSG